MLEVAGIRFRRSRKLHFCDARGHDLRPGDYAIVRTTSGPELAKVTLGTAATTPETKTYNRHVVRRATLRDLESMRRLAQREVDARLDFFRAAAAEGVFVSAVRADYRFDGNVLRLKFRSDTPPSETMMRSRLEPKYAGRIELLNLGAPKKTGDSSGCGGGSCSSCPSNGLRERAAAVAPRPGFATPGAFVLTRGLAAAAIQA